MSSRDTIHQDPPPGATADQSQDVAALAAKVLAVRRPSRAIPPGRRSLPRPWWRRWLSAACVFAVWVLALALATLAALRICYHDGTYPLVCINAFTLYLYLPAYAILAWASWRRRWFLAAASGLVICCHVAWVAPDFYPAARSSPPPPGAAAPSPTMRVFFANVLAGNTEYQPMLHEIAEANPDVVVLAECSPRWYRALKGSPILAPYVYREQQANIGRISCFSRLPVVTAEEPRATNRYCRILTIRLGDDLVRLLCLHGPRPMELPWYDYAGYWKLVLPIIARQPEPLVVVGDFNATQHSNIYEQLTSGRLRSAHEDRGRGYATTWPNGQHWLPPIRIDQALLSRDVECLGIAEGRGQGSDHRPLILDVRVRHDWPTSSTHQPGADDGHPNGGN